VTVVLARDHNVLVCCNVGSAADAQHFAAELVGRFRVPGRPGLAMIALGSNLPVLSAWSNDAEWEDGFAREVQALGRPGDLLIGISTTGASRNVVRAFEQAREQGLKTLAFTGGDGGSLRRLADHAVIVPSRDTQSIQEVHTLLVHLVSEFVERRLVEAGWFGPDVRLPEPTAGAPAHARRPTPRGHGEKARAAIPERSVR